MVIKSAVQARTPRQLKQCFLQGLKIPDSPATLKLPEITGNVVSFVPTTAGTPTASSSSGSTSVPASQSRLQPPGQPGTARKLQFSTVPKVAKTPHPTAKASHTFTGSVPLPPNTPFRTTYYAQAQVPHLVTNSGTQDPDAEDIKLPKLITHSMPTKFMNLTWDGKLSTVYSFIERMEGWFPSVHCEPLLRRDTLDFYAKEGMETFVQVYGPPHGDPYCNIPQIGHTVNFLYSMLSITFQGTPAQSIVRRYKGSYDGWLVWHAFLHQFEKQGVNQARSAYHMEALTHFYAEEPRHSADVLYRFVNNFESNMSYLVELSPHWTDTACKRHFLLVVAHESTQWLITKANDEDRSYIETINLFREAASGSLRSSQMDARKRRAQLAGQLVPSEPAETTTEPLSPTDQDTVHAYAAQQSLRIADSLWAALPADAKGAIQEARDRLQQDSPSS